MEGLIHYSDYASREKTEHTPRFASDAGDLRPWEVYSQTALDQDGILSQQAMAAMTPEALAKQYRESWEKYLLELGLSGIGSVFAVPIIGLATAATKIESLTTKKKGQHNAPVFYKCTRIGENGRPITFWKIRTMIPGADKLYGQEQITAFNAKGEDPRVTRIGKLLRMAELDELPQIIQIFLGKLGLLQEEMDLAGPDRAIGHEAMEEMKKKGAQFAARAEEARSAGDVALAEEMAAKAQKYMEWEKGYPNARPVLFPVNGLKRIPGIKNDDERLEAIDYRKNQNFWGDVKIIAGTITGLSAKVAKKAVVNIFARQQSTTAIQQTHDAEYSMYHTNGD